MGYLLPIEYVQYGLSAETTDDWITTASALIDAHCKRASLKVTPYTERLRVSAGAESVLLSYRPLAAAEDASSPLISVQVRYGRPRRGELADIFREQVASAFSIPGTWTELDVASIDFDAMTGRLALPGNFLGLGYNEVEVSYTSGLSVISPGVKVACAQIVKNAQATPALNVKSSRLDILQMQYFSGSLIDTHVQMLLRPYVAERLG